MDEQMLQYIRTRKSVRVPDDMIRQELQGVGWDAASIDAAFASLVPAPPPQSTPPPATTTPQPTPQTQVTPAATVTTPPTSTNTASAAATPAAQPIATPATTPVPAPQPATPQPEPQPAAPNTIAPPTETTLSVSPTPPTTEPTPTTAQSQTAPSGAKRILLVEDEKALATVMSLKLKNAGYDVVVVYNGDDALRTLGGSYFDLMLVDIMMPKRDGFSVLEELKKQNNQIPVFAMSNLGQEEDIARVKSMGVKEYIVKADASPTDILGRVDAFLKH